MESHTNRYGTWYAGGCHACDIPCRVRLDVIYQVDFERGMKETPDSTEYKFNTSRPRLRAARCAVPSPNSHSQVTHCLYPRRLLVDPASLPTRSISRPLGATHLRRYYYRYLQRSRCSVLFTKTVVTLGSYSQPSGFCVTAGQCSYGEISWEKAALLHGLFRSEVRRQYYLRRVHVCSVVPQTA